MRSRGNLAIDPSWVRVTVQEPVGFFDLDADRVVGHGHYLRFLECGRRAFLLQAGLNYAWMMARNWSMPIVRLNLEYLSKSCLDDRLDITVASRPNDKCLLELVFHLHHQTGRLVCRAEAIHCLCDTSNEVFRTRPADLAAFFAAITPRSDPAHAPHP